MFTAQEVVMLVGISLGRLRYIEKRGIVKPASRHGRKRLYGMGELISIDLSKTLQEGGLPIRRFGCRLPAIHGIIQAMARFNQNIVVLCEKATVQWLIFADDVADHKVDPEERVKYSAADLRAKLAQRFPGTLQPRLRLVQ